MKKALISFFVIIITFSTLVFIFSFAEKPTKVFGLYVENASSTDYMFSNGVEPLVINTDFLNKTKESFISQKADFIEADLKNMTLNLYKNGQIVLNFKIQSKGRPGSWWETPAGIYKIELKEKRHFSSIGKVYQPWSMQFQGNFFIHGWPYYENGQETSSQFTGGCIKLNTEDANSLYNEVDIGIPVLVFSQGKSDDNFTYSLKIPEISSSHYLAADLENNFIFASKNESEIVPIASLTKLMTALVASEYINLGKTIPINIESIVYTSKSRLTVGTGIEAFELLHLLLEESSNEAAEVLASYIGRERFISLMNKKAIAIGLKNTSFVDPSGSGNGNLSTAEDLFLLSKYILDNRSFIFKISAGLLNQGINNNFIFNSLGNYNEFTNQNGFVGGKVGETRFAHQTILSVFNLLINKDVERPIVFISLGSDDKKGDITKLKEYVEQYFVNQ